LAAVVWMILAGPAAGRIAAAAAYALAAAVAYVATIAPSAARGLKAGLLAAGLAVLAVFVATGTGLVGIAAAAALIVAICRSGFLYRSTPARALLVEGALVGGGLILARLLGSFSPLGWGLAVWTFFLVQSAFFAIGGVALRRFEPEGIDPFEGAQERILALIEEPPAGRG
jgi:hypothetical protein